MGLGVTPFVQEESTRRGPAQQLVDIVKEAGGIALLAHPYWSGQDIDDILIVEGAFGVEIYNASCVRSGTERSETYWDGLLQRGRKIWGIACDDAHNYEEQAAEGWVMVRASALTQEAILQALDAGDFYTTRGPAILDIGMDGESIWAHCSPVSQIRFVGIKGTGRAALAPRGESITSGRAQLPKSPYVRVECTDALGRTAWSQPIFLSK